MRKNTLLAALLLMLMATFSSCAVIGGIFKVGVWVGIIIVVAIIALVLWIVGKAKK